jgi:deoxyribose-phosphate aldolase
VVLLGSSKDSAVCETIRRLANLGLPDVCRDLSGKTRLDQAFSVIGHARAMVGNDSGLMHIAAALGVPQVAAVCVYPAMVRHARKALGSDTAVRIASVATAFPSGQAPLKTRLAEVKAAVADGADEIDMVINRGAFLAGEFGRVQDEISAVVTACGAATLKVILEVSELETYDSIRAASFLAMRVIRPGDFIKTSTGKTSLNATLGNNQVMLEAIRDFYLDTGVAIAMKPAGGIRTAKQALTFLIADTRMSFPDQDSASITDTYRKAAESNNVSLTAFSRNYAEHLFQTAQMIYRRYTKDQAAFVDFEDQRVPLLAIMMRELSIHKTVFA